jgi:hypothetical protein
MAHPDLRSETAIRLLRAKSSELENYAKVMLAPEHPGSPQLGHLAADIAFVAELLAELWERLDPEVAPIAPWSPSRSRQQR